MLRRSSHRSGRHWFDAGLRFWAPHYGPGPYCYGTGSTGGLKGKACLLKEMDPGRHVTGCNHLAIILLGSSGDFQGPVLVIITAVPWWMRIVS
ncbi:hypothetical protein [Gimesia sp.]|uniref:hypothetical protein n=1 Tax=Gimesia sp. TaxID=2024833 RepID=UPI003A8E91F4